MNHNDLQNRVAQGANGAGLFSRSSSRSRRALEAESHRAAFGSAVVAEGKSTGDAVSQGFGFGVCLRLVDSGTPLARQWRIGGSGQSAAFLGGLLTSVGRTPRPVFREVIAATTR